MRASCEILIFIIIIVVFRLKGAKVTKKLNDQLYKFDRSAQELIIAVKNNNDKK